MFAGSPVEARALADAAADYSEQERSALFRNSAGKTDRLTSTLKEC